MSNFNWKELFEKFEDIDNDLRFMGLSDLTKNLEKGLDMQGVTEGRVVTYLLKLFFDTSTDVQGASVRCLIPLTNKLEEENVTKLLQTLSSYMTSESKSKYRETCLLGLKSIISVVKKEYQESVGNFLFQEITKGFKNGNEETSTDALEILTDMITKFPQVMSNHSVNILKAIMPFLSSVKQINAKRTINCLEALSMYLTPNLFDNTISGILKEMETNPKKKSVCIQALSSLAKTAGPKLAKHVEAISPQLVSAIDSKGDSKEDIILKESAIQCFRSFFLSCRSSVDKYFDTVLDKTLEYLSFDPNMAEDDDSEEMSDEEDDDDDDDDYDQDDIVDDNTWQIRRASAKTLNTIIFTTPSKSKELCEKIGPIVIKRFNEREETVRGEILELFRLIIKQVSTPKLRSILKGWVPSIISNIIKQLKIAPKIKNNNVTISIFSMLKEICSGDQNVFEDHLSTLSPSLNEFIVNKKNISLQQESLNLSINIFKTHNPDLLKKFVSEFSKSTLVSLKSENLQVISSSILFVGQISKITAESEISLIESLLNGILPFYEATDIDQSVKENSISSVSQIVYYFGNKIQNTNKIISTLVERLNNEVTRPAAINAVNLITKSPLKIDLSDFEKVLFTELTNCLKLSNRQTTTSSLSALTSLVNNYGEKSTHFPSHSVAIIEQGCKLLQENDLYVSQLALNLVSSAITAHPSSFQSVNHTNFTKSVETLIKSPQMEGASLESLSNLYKSILNSNTKSFAYGDLLSPLLKLANDENVKKENSYAGISTCVASITLATKEENRNKSITYFLSSIKTLKSDAVIALYCIGEIGRRIDLSDNFEALHEVISKSVLSKNEEIINASSFALGSICFGNLEKYLPILLKDAQSDNEKQYAILNALKLVISHSVTDQERAKQIEKHLDQIVDLLSKIKTDETISRNVVSECYGKLFTLNPEKLFSTFSESLKSSDVSVKSCIVSALKYVRFDQDNHVLFDLLKSKIENFLGLISDESVSVRSSVLSSLNFISSRAPSIVQNYILLNNSFFPSFYNQTIIKQELIKTIDLGPIKHKVDSGLELRKLSFQCMITFLDNIPEVVNHTEYLKCLSYALVDDEEIKLLCYMLLVRLAKLCGPLVVESLPSFVDTIISDVQKGGDTAVKRNAVQAFAALSLIPNSAGVSKKFDEALLNLDKFGIVELFKKSKLELQN